MEKKTRETVPFRPRARLIHTIGEDLIKDEIGGIIELIKNAYDADAKKVTITFINLNSEGSSMIIEDNGHGMSRRTILEEWMSPATVIKESEKSSPQGRSMLGRKGIGRFSAMRLGNRMILESTPGKNAPQISDEDLSKRCQLKVDWKKFQDSQYYLDELMLDIDIFDGSPEDDHWTRLKIYDLNDKWDITRLRRLLRELILLLSPIVTKTEREFSIYLELPNSDSKGEEIKGFPEKIEPYDVPEIRDYDVKANIMEDGRYTIEYRRTLYSDDDNEEIVETISDIDIRKRFIDDAVKIPLPLPCGPLEFRFQIWDRDVEILKMKLESDDFKPLGIRGLRQMLNDIMGVSIYRDGFRVRPYGDADQDWLKLAQRRVQNPTQRIGPNQLLGIVNISAVNNSNLEDKASREGLKENIAFETLRQCALGILSWAEPYRYRFRRRNYLGRPVSKSTRALVEARQEAFKKLRQRAEHLISIKNIEQFKVVISKAEDFIEREHERLSMQTELLHDNHALGMLSRFVLHEGRNINGTLDSALENLKRVSRNSIRYKPLSYIIVKEDFALFDLSIRSSLESGEQMRVLFNRLDPLMKPRLKRKTVTVQESAEKVRSILAPTLKANNISLNIDDGRHKIIAIEADVFHAIFNILHNSIYWVQQREGMRKINIKIRYQEKENSEKKLKVEISISDSGPGINIKVAPSIFELGTTEKPGGYGVGLFIAREAIDRSKGSIELINPGDQGAEFLIIFEGV